MDNWFDKQPAPRESPAGSVIYRYSGEDLRGFGPIRDLFRKNVFDPARSSYI